MKTLKMANVDVTRFFSEKGQQMNHEPLFVLGSINIGVSPRKGLYLVSRTSAYDQKPCDEAFKIVKVDIDVRHCDDPKKIPGHNGTDGDWFLCGTNHRIENGHIKRDLGTKEEWVVEIADIQTFVDKYGQCIVGRDIDGFCTIEIYDVYRE